MAKQENKPIPPQEWSKTDFSLVADHLESLSGLNHLDKEFLPHAVNIIKRGLEQNYLYWLINNPGKSGSTQREASMAAKRTIEAYELYTGKNLNLR